MCLTVFYAAFDEWHQSFVPGRSPSPWDVAIDCAGSVIGLGSWIWARGKNFCLMRNTRANPASGKDFPE